MEMATQDMDDLRKAKHLLEEVSFAAKVTGVIGRPLERGLQLLPSKLGAVLSRATRAALQHALGVAVKSVGDEGPKTPTNLLHKIAVTATGAAGGMFGLAGLPVELPLSTTIMLRSIVEIARSQGEKIRSVESKLACIEVFALGGRSQSDDAAEIGYFAVRAALARAVSEAAQYISERGLAHQGAPAVVRFIAQVASRFGVTVSEKVAAQAIPVAGAAGAAVLNLLFMDHFQDTATGHFTIRRLERTYSPEIVRSTYERL
jgi:hypothetical protein